MLYRLLPDFIFANVRTDMNEGNGPKMPFSELVFSEFPELMAPARSGDFKIVDNRNGTVTVFWPNTAILAPTYLQLEYLVKTIAPDFPRQYIALKSSGIVGIEFTLKASL
jgi:hypothetical protein